MNIKALIPVYIIFFLLVFSYRANSQQTVVSGKASGYAGSEIELYTYDDYITFHPRQITSSLIDNQGNFKINCSLNGTIKAYLRIENIASHLFLEENKNYQVIIPNFDPAKSKLEGGLNWVPLQFLNQDSNELNNLIINFNKSFDKFLDSNYSLIITKQAGPKIQAFKKQTELKYKEINNSYFKDFTDYSLAAIDQFGSGKQKLFSRYIDKKPLAYSNQEYMKFICDFFNNYLINLTHSKNGPKLIETINKKDYRSALSMMQKDSMLENNALCELIFLKGLYNAYYQDIFEKKSMDIIFEKIASQGQNTENQKIAKNIILKTSKLTPGQKAPDFKLIDSRGKNILLSEFKGKYVYLNFWTSWNLSCLQDLKMMESLHEKYGDKIQFVSISIDNSQKQMEDFLKKHHYNWIFLHFGNQKKIKEDYDIFSTPSYFLIGPDGKFIQSPAETPSGYIASTFAKLTQTPEKKVKVGEK